MRAWAKSTAGSPRASTPKPGAVVSVSPGAIGGFGANHPKRRKSLGGHVIVRAFAKTPTNAAIFRVALIETSSLSVFSS
jgi:hypothetical protein